MVRCSRGKIDRFVKMSFVSAVEEAMAGIAQHGPIAVALFTGNDFFSYDKGTTCF